MKNLTQIIVGVAFAAGLSAALTGPLSPAADDPSISAPDGPPPARLHPGDYNEDGQVDIADMAAFRLAMDRNDPKADLTAPWGTVDALDWHEFLRRYNMLYAEC